MTGIAHFAQSSDIAPTSGISFAFDVLGRQTNWSYGDYSGQTAFDDVQGKVTHTVDYGAFTKSSTLYYDEMRRPTRFEGPDGRVVEYTYDERRRLKALELEGEGAVLFGGYTANRATEITLPGGTEIRTTLGSFTVLSNRVLDAASNLIHDVEYLAAGSDKLRVMNTSAGTSTYAYDKLGFVTNVDSTLNGVEAYEYDAVGNRLSGPTGGVICLYNELNQLTNSGSAEFVYSPAGELIRRIEGGLSTYYEYDFAGCLAAIRDDGSNLVARYAYSPDGRRLMKDLGGQKTYFFYGNDGLCAEFDATGGVKRTFGFIPGHAWGQKPLFMSSGSNTYYYVTDFKGTPTHLVAKSGAVVWRAETETFGRAHVDASSTVANPLRASSQYYDAESGLHYNFKRYYDPDIGRYLCRDPIEENGGINLYTFANNNPVNNTDPRGLNWQHQFCRGLSKPYEPEDDGGDDQEPNGPTFGVSFGAGASLSGGISGQICDCCNKDSGRYILEDHVNATASFTVTLIAGFSVKAYVPGAVNIDAGVEVIRVPIGLNGSYNKECGKALGEFVLSKKFEPEFGAFLSGKGTLAGSDEIGGEANNGIRLKCEAGVRGNLNDVYFFATCNWQDIEGAKLSLPCPIPDWVTELTGLKCPWKPEYESPPNPASMNEPAFEPWRYPPKRNPLR